MAYTSCAGAVAASIQQNCENPLVGGYTGRAVLIDLANVTPTWTVDSQNPRIITAVSLGTGEKFIAVDNVWADPFNGSSTASSADNGRTTYNKTFSFHIPQRGADVSKDFVEPLVGSPLGFAAILEKQDRSGDGSFEIVGYKKGLKVNADGVQRNELENGGDIVVTMSCDEPWFEVVLFATDYATTKAAFDAMLNNSYD